MRKFFYFNKYQNSICVEVYRFPCVRVGISFEEGVNFRIGVFIQLFLSFNFKRLNSWLYKKGIEGKELEFNIGFLDGLSMSLNLMSDDSMSWGRGRWKWYWNITDRIKGKVEVLKKIIEERDILVPMPEKSYNAHAVLADWTWKYQRWFPMTVRRCEINIPEGLPHAGKGENSWDCEDDATFSMTTGKVRNIPEAIGRLVGSTLHTRIKNGGWGDYKWDRPK